MCGISKQWLHSGGRGGRRGIFASISAAVAVVAGGDVVAVVDVVIIAVDVVIIIVVVAAVIIVPVACWNWRDDKIFSPKMQHKAQDHCQEREWKIEHKHSTPEHNQHHSVCVARARGALKHREKGIMVAKLRNDAVLDHVCFVCSK